VEITNTLLISNSPLSEGMLAQPLVGVIDLVRHILVTGGDQRLHRQILLVLMEYRLSFSPAGLPG
jgi:hypothetical protein